MVRREELGGAIKIGEVAKKDKPLTVEFEGGAKMQITYDSTFITPEWLDRPDEELQREKLEDQILNTVKTWQLEEDNSTPEKPVFIPLKKERLRKVPVTILSGVLRAVLDDMFPNKQRSTPSTSFS